MTRFIGRFVGHYDNRREWQYMIWLNLTAKGHQASNDMVKAKAPNS